MRQSITFLTVLMVALLLVTGFIVAGNITQSDQLTMQASAVANLKLKLREQQSLYDDLQTTADSQAASLTVITAQRDELRVNLDDVMSSINETNDAIAQQTTDMENSAIKHEQEISALSDALTQSQDDANALETDLDDMTAQRDNLSEALAIARGDLELEVGKSVAASAAYDQSLIADQQSIKDLTSEGEAFMELLTFWGRVRSGDAKETSLHQLKRTFEDSYPDSIFILPNLEVPQATPTAAIVPSDMPAHSPAPTQIKTPVQTAAPVKTAAPTKTEAPAPSPRPSFIPIVTTTP
ncbi:MAG: hypothetical protein GX096_05490 [Clostridiales bacterium]|nr:hypothetical protein [Clostridiales bacterium]